MTTPDRSPEPRQAAFSPLLVALAVGLVVIAAAWIVAAVEQRQVDSRLRADTVSRVSAQRAEIEKALNARLALVDGLGAFVRANPSFDDAAFGTFAAGLSSSSRSFLSESGIDPAVRSLQLAPDAVVTFVHPLEGNAAAVGHDLLADPDRRDAVLQAIANREFVLAGPFELLQGGLGLVGRSPIYLPAPSGGEDFWGLAVIVINFDVLQSQVGLVSQTDDGLMFAMRGRNGLGAEGEVFFGAADVFDADPVIFDITVPNGSWQLAAAPSTGWHAATAVPWAIRLAGLAAGLMTALMLWRWARARLEVSRVSAALAHLVDSANAPIIAVDVTGRVTEWNRHASEMTGIPAAAIVGKPLGDSPLAAMNSEEDRARTAEALMAVFRGEERRQFDVRWNTGAGRPMTLSFNITPSRDANGAIVGAVAIGQDITARLETERIKSENTAMARTARLKDQFLASMSHELRTPLNAVIGLSSILNRETFGPLNEKQKDYVGQVERSGRHLLELINDMLDLAKVEAGEAALELGEVVPEAVARDAMSMVVELATEKGLTLSTAIPESLPSFLGDERRVRQVLLNLLSNAIKFTPDGGEVGLEVTASEDAVDFTVWDTGIGIAHDKRSVLFEPFQQVDSELSRAYEGTGLGLALSRQLVSMHGGVIDVESAEGEGSRFTARFPIDVERRPLTEPGGGAEVELARLSSVAPESTR